ncbi:glycosyltransferase family 2 protein [Formosa sp. 3Alg 14/1]|uniref:glycosyltransferase family 2 protein n=1 Tax=unclassified Formosa TaxID=2644710 RepID=UPI0039BE8F8D
MLSVLIPIYNYNVVNLVQNLHKQLMQGNYAFEIICLDDASANEFVLANSKIETLEFTSLIKSTTNNGRTKTRQLLSQASKYDWLLFLDADTMPVSETFISQYLTAITEEYEAVFGGFSYHKKKPSSAYILRWEYGRKKEEINASIRNTNPYKIIISANFLIKKSIFETLNSLVKHKVYGLDNYFGALLKNHNVKVLHINNPVYHLGLEKNEVYLNKLKSAAHTLLLLVKQDKMKTHNNDLLSLFMFLKKTKLSFVLSKFYRAFNKQMEMNLCGNTPSIKILQFYRISYMCYADQNS